MLFRSLPDQIDRLKARCLCAWNWITTFSPEDFRFAVATADSPLVELSSEEQKVVKVLAAKVAAWDGEDEKELSQRIYDAAAEAEVETTVLFTAVYRILINKEKGPKLAGFMKTIGKDKVLSLLERY